jgi:hypothetical protein
MERNPKPTRLQLENRRRLIKYLEEGRLRSRFDMRNFTQTAIGGEYETDCGTVGCAIGHAPHAGIVKTDFENWYQYSDRAFGLKEDSPQWMYCFCPDWSGFDNTPQGAAARLRTITEREHTLEELQDKTPFLLSNWLSEKWTTV